MLPKANNNKRTSSSSPNPEKGAKQRKSSQESDLLPIMSQAPEHREVIEREFEDFNNVKKYYDESVQKVQREGSIMTMCKEHITSMQRLINDISGKVIVTLFAKPGYGKSYIINRLLSGFKLDGVPLPSLVSMGGSGLTSSVIDVEYSDTYSLSIRYCTQQDYQARGIDIPDAIDLSDIIKEIDNQSNLYLDHSLSEDEKYECIAHRASQQIQEFEKTKTHEDAQSIKKLILKMPSNYLKESNIILRDMPGYDEKTEGNMFKKLIRESMQDTCLLLCGIENYRNVLDEGIVRKVWEYGIHQPNQTIQPYIALIGNARDMKNDTLYQQVINDDKLITKLKTAFGKQLALSFDCDLDGVQVSVPNNSCRSNLNTQDSQDIQDTNVNEIPNSDFENKYEFVKGLHENFDVAFFPPSETKLQETFLTKFRTIIENNRKKIIDYNISLLRDMAIVVLSNTNIKHAVKIPKNIAKELKKCVTKISSSLQKVVDGLKSNYPDPFNINTINVESFVNSFVKFFEKPILAGFDLKEIELELQKVRTTKRKQFKVQSRIKKWDECFGQFSSDFIVKLDSFLTLFRNSVQEFKKQLNNTCMIFWTYIKEDFEVELCRALNPNETEDQTTDTDILAIYNQVLEFESKVTSYFEYTVQSWNEISVGLVEKVKELLQKYKNKVSQNDSIFIEHNSKFPDPSRLDANLSLPDKECQDVTKVKEGSFCAHNDALMKFKIKKRKRTEISVVSIGSNQATTNEIRVTFNREQKQLELNYNEQYIESKLKGIKSLTSNCLKPVFIKSRPRGGVWKPNLYSNLVQSTLRTKLPKEKEDVVAGLSQFVAIVTESKYVHRYKEWIIMNGCTIDDYIFIVLESDQALGPGIVHSSILAIGKYFKLEAIHIVQDDIRVFYEYSSAQKVYVTHDFSMMRSLQYMEKVLAYELFNPRKRKERLVKLKQILLGKVFNSEFKEVLIQAVKKDIHDEELIEEIEQDQISMLGLLGAYIVECIKNRREREVYNSRITAITNTESSEGALLSIIENPQSFVELLKEMNRKHKITLASTLFNMLEDLFDDKKHIGRVSLWNYQVNETLKCKIHNLVKPTHLISYQTSGINTYFLPSMEGIYPISLTDFWTEPNNMERKALLNKLTSPSKKNPSSNRKEGSGRGWCDLDICEKSQMLLNGVGGFQVFCFGYSSMSANSLINYKGREKNNFDSDNDNDIDDGGEAEEYVNNIKDETDDEMED